MARFDVSVSHDLHKMRRTLSRIERRALPKAAQAALNRAARSAQGAWIKATAKQLGLKQSRVKRAFEFFPARLQRLVVVIHGRGRPINLIAFTGRGETRQRAFKRGGVRAKVGGRWQMFPGTFIANRGRTVFRRLSKIRKHLEGVIGGSVPFTMGLPSVRRALDRKFAERWPVEIGRALDNEIRKQR